MPMRPCLDCRRPTDEGSRCAPCRSQRERDRGTTTERGYGAEHQAKLLDPDYLAATHCDHCGDPFTVDNPRTGGHSTPVRHGGKDDDAPVVPHCRRCNSGWARTGL